MSGSDYFRVQAAWCVSVSRACYDLSVAQMLRLKAAEFTAKAKAAEFTAKAAELEQETKDPPINKMLREIVRRTH